MSSAWLLFFFIAYSRAQCVDTFPYELDYGFYVAIPSAEDGQYVTFEKSCIGNISAAFNPNICTHYFLHGLQPDAVENNMRVTDYPEVRHAALVHLNLGCNFVFFLYTQFADESIINVNRAQDKLWDPTFVANMEYTFWNNDTGRVEIGDMPNPRSVSDLFVELYAAHQTQPLNPDEEVVLIGHSLGSQLAVLVATNIYNNDTILVKPTQVAMLDPVFTPSSKHFIIAHECGPTVGEVISCMMSDLIQLGVGMSYFRSSVLNVCIGSSSINTGMVMNSAFAHVKIHREGDRSIDQCYLSELAKSPTHITSIYKQILSQHGDIIIWYLFSWIMPPHRCIITNSTEDGCTPLQSLALSGAMSTKDILYWSQAHDGAPKRCFVQYDDNIRSAQGATMTVLPNDDLFYTTPCNKMHV